MTATELVRKDYLLLISAVLAVLSLFIVPIETVLTYDYMRIMETIFILLFFLLIVAGMKECNLLSKLAHRALSNTRSSTALCLVLVFLPFFTAMFFSNDVSLVTFVPIAIAVLGMADMKAVTGIVVVLQTAAANIGSYLTPFGNPHNLYIFNLKDLYGFSLWEYELALLPIVLAGAALLLLMTLLIRRRPLEVQIDDYVQVKGRSYVIAMFVLFVIAILSVLDIVPFYISAVIIIGAFLVMMPQIFKKIDYSILFIFFFLFVFANGLTNVESVHSILSGLMDWDPMLTTVMVSQFTSNLPAAILLQPFTENWAAVLVGADIGGFGTPLASMASIITLKIYMDDKDSSLKGFFKPFLLVNFAMLAVLIPTWYLFG